MVKGKSLGLALVICWLVACAPSAQALQTATAHTQAAWTPTPTPTYTATITPSPSSTPTLTPSSTSITTPPSGNAAAGPGILAVSNTYQLPPQIFGAILATSPGKIWLGSPFGTIEEFDIQTGTFVKSISLPHSKMAVDNMNTLTKIEFDGQNLWALGGGASENGGAVSLFAIDPDSGTIIHQWDLTSTEWQKNHFVFYTDANFGFSPGKVWVQGHVIDTQTFEAKAVSTGLPGEPIYVDDGKGWMWITGSVAEDCSELSTIGMGSQMTLAGDRMWFTGGSLASSGGKPTYDLEAYSADTDQLMKETKPLVIVPWTDDTAEMKMLFAGNFLWVLTTHGDKRGYLYQLDPQTGATLNTLDVIGNQRGNGFSDVKDMATDGVYLWITEMGYLLRIKLP
ncbi:MAG: hypothetical protein ABSF99_13100 [Anaerolineales bacterium]|jgi:hypothetical protein